MSTKSIKTNLELVPNFRFVAVFKLEFSKKKPNINKIQTNISKRADIIWNKDNNNYKWIQSIIFIISYRRSKININDVEGKNDLSTKKEINFKIL